MPLILIRALPTFLLMAGFCGAKGISVRFLANPPEDSIVRYEVYRSLAPDGTPQILGEVKPVPGQDTLTFPDLLAEKGKPYLYRILGVDAEGLASEPSASTEIAFPALALPDSLIPDRSGGPTRFLLPAGADPLRGSAPLSLSLLDSSRLSLAYDPATGAATFRSRSGQADTVRAVVRAEYYGKFEDRDSVLILVAAQDPTAANLAPAFPGPRNPVFPLRYSPRQGPISLSGLPGPGQLDVLAASGVRAVGFALPGPDARLVWDGKDRSGRSLRPAPYLWVVRGTSGAVLASGRMLILP